MQWADLLGAFQMLGVIAALWGAYAGMRARDNARAATLAEIQTDIRHIIKRMDAMERALKSVNSRVTKHIEDDREKRRMGA